MIWIIISDGEINGHSKIDIYIYFIGFSTFSSGGYKHCGTLEQGISSYNRVSDHSLE